MIQIRRGQAPVRPERTEFSARFRASFVDPAFRAEDRSIAKLEEIAWQAYAEGRKAPFTQDAGAGYADPGYQLSIEWVATRKRIDDAQRTFPGNRACGVDARDCSITGRACGRPRERSVLFSLRKCAGAPTRSAHSSNLRSMAARSGAP